MITANQRVFQDINKSAVLRIIQVHGPISRAEIADITRLSPTTVSNIVGELIEIGIVSELGPGESKGGRKPILVDIDPKGGYLIGVHVGETKILGGVMNLRGEIQHQKKLPTPANAGNEIMETITLIIEDLFKWSARKNIPILGIGISSPGLIDGENGNVIQAANLNWSHFPLRERIEQKFKIRTYLGNDTNLAALGEARKYLQEGYQNILYVSLGTGIGAGIIVNGKVLTGKGMVGEIGHMTVLKDGPQCRCGKRGCLEAVASGYAISRDAEIIIKAKGIPYVEPLEVPFIVKAAQRGQSEFKRLIDYAADLIGLSIGNLINVLDPELVILGGGMMKSGDYFRERITHAVYQHMIPGTVKPPIVVGNHLDDAGMVGAAFFALQESIMPKVVSSGTIISSGEYSIHGSAGFAGSSQD